MSFWPKNNFFYSYNNQPLEKHLQGHLLEWFSRGDWTGWEIISVGSLPHKMGKSRWFLKVHSNQGYFAILWMILENLLCPRGKKKKEIIIFSCRSGWKDVRQKMLDGAWSNQWKMSLGWNWVNFSILFNPNHSTIPVFMCRNTPTYAGFLFTLIYPFSICNCSFHFMTSIWNQSSWAGELPFWRNEFHVRTKLWLSGISQENINIFFM